MQKLFWLFRVMNFTFLQRFYIRQLLILGHVCPEPVDKHDSVKIFYPTHLTPSVGSKVKYLNFSSQYFLPKFCMQSEEQYILNTSDEVLVYALGPTP